jgi:hypothetical protein
MATIPATYEASRGRFRAALAPFSGRWPSARLTSHPLADTPELTIDTLSADATREPQRLLIITTGLHGIEGYVGSGILQLFVDEFLPRLDPETTGLLLVHPVNPYGMKHHTRGNKNSVDLNRNFNSDFESFKSLNPHYESLTYLLNPARPLKKPLYEKLAFLWNVVKALPKGVGHVRETALMGQYRVNNGMYFGGSELQEETLILQDLFRASVTSYAQVVALDIHTGYGPRWQMTLVNPPSATRTADETASRFKVPRVAGTNPEEFFSIHGDMTDFVHALAAPEKIQSYIGTFEFGTYGDSLWQGIHSLRTTALENCLRWFGGSEAARTWLAREYNELYLPSDPRWWDKAQADARQYFNGILSTEGFLG